MKQVALIQIAKGSLLFKEGDAGYFFYIVKSGTLKLSLAQQDETKILSRGDCFGELALIQKNKRSGGVLCVEDAEVFCLEGIIFREIVNKINSIDLKERIYLLNLIPLFQGLNSIQLNSVANSMIKCEFKEGHTIITEGEKGESLFIIKEGVISCEKENIEIRKLHSKDYFGESSILFETRRSLNIKSLTRSICYNITRNVLIEALGNEFKQSLLIGICKESFLKSKIMKHLIFHDYFAKMYPAFKLHFYTDGEVIVNKSTKSYSKILIIIQGNILSVNLKIYLNCILLIIF